MGVALHRHGEDAFDLPVELWVVIEKMILRIQAAEIGFLRRVSEPQSSAQRSQKEPEGVVQASD